MKTLSSIWLAVSLLAGVVVADTVYAAERVNLGARHVNDRTERDTIRVGAHRGKFTALQFKVTGSAVEFKRVVVHFENGSDQVFEKNRLLGKGERTRRIDLQGGARKIDKVVFHYEARSAGWKGAELTLFGIRR